MFQGTILARIWLTNQVIIGYDEYRNVPVIF